MWLFGVMLNFKLKILTSISSSLETSRGESLRSCQHPEATDNIVDCHSLRNLTEEPLIFLGLQRDIAEKIADHFIYLWGVERGGKARKKAPPEEKKVTKDISVLYVGKHTCHPEG